MPLPPIDAVPGLFLASDWQSVRNFPPDGLRADEMAGADAAIRAEPTYVPTPVRQLPGLARALGVAEILLKDESQRFGLGGVKALGAPHGLRMALAVRGLAAGQPGVEAITAVAATDGNHGLALAWAARRVGCRARIFVGEAVDARRVARIEAAGGEVVRVAGTYDDAVAAAADASRRPDTLLITDTDPGSDPAGELPVTRAILAGYSVLAREWLNQADFSTCTHLFLPCGVGGVAAGVVAGLWQASGRVPRTVLVEPERAACALASLRAGRSTRVEGDLATRMVGLSCGELSLPAWRILSQAAFAAMTVTEDTALAVQQAVGEGLAGDAPLDSGDTGVASLAALCAAARDPSARTRLGLDEHSRVWLINSEGRLA